MFCHAPTTRKPNAHMFCHAPMYTSFVPYHHVMEAKCANERARFWRFASLLLLGLAFPKAAGLLIRFAVDFIFTMALIHLVCAFFGGVSSFACRKFCSGKRCCSNKPPAHDNTSCKATKSCCSSKAAKSENTAAPLPPAPHRRRARKESEHRWRRRDVGVGRGVLRVTRAARREARRAEPQRAARLRARRHAALAHRLPAVGRPAHRHPAQ